MDIGIFRTKASELIKKYRYAGIVLIVGLVLMVLPTGNKEKSLTVPTESENCTSTSADETLAQILRKIEGAGEVHVLLTIASGEETIYQTDDNISVSENSSTTQVDTVTVTDANRNQAGLIKQINPPVYQGAIIVCQGASSASVRLAIVDAVSKVTGLNSTNISVLKMK